jgi:phage terminase large subunit-like protein
MTTAARPVRRKTPPQAKHPHVATAMTYIRQVVAKKLPACKWVRLACQRHIDDVKRSKTPAYPFRFDPDLAERRCEFEELLPHVKGHWADPDPKHPEKIHLRLEPWQCFERCMMFGWVEKGTGFRRFHTAYREIPRKNGKSMGAAVDGLYCLTADREYGAEVFSGAVTEKQAWEVFRPAKLMAQRTPDFLDFYGVQVNAKNLATPKNGGRFEPIIGKPGDGSSPSCAIVDEYHEHLDSTLFDTMLTGMAARRQALMNVITTAGSDIAGPCYALRDRVVKMLEGTQPDERLFGVIYTIDEGVDWTSEKALRMANPNFGISVLSDWLRKQQQDAVENARQQNLFKTKHLNVWVTSRTAWMNMEWWNRQADPSLKVQDFVKQPCFAGVDLASKLDLSSVCRVFKKTLEGVPHYYAFWRHYLPSATVEDPKNRRYQGWEVEGHLTVTEGDMTDFDRLRDDLFSDAKMHGLAEVAFDAWGSESIVRDCTNQGLTALQVPQTTKYFSDAMKSVEALVKAGQFHHTGDPVAAWAVSNVTVKEDPNENIFPRKERPENKIDPAVALFMAIYRCTVSETPDYSITFLGGR